MSAIISITNFGYALADGSWTCYLGKAAGFSATVLKSASMGYHILNHGLNDFGNEFSDEAFVQLGVDWYNGKDIQVRFGAP